MWSFSKGKPVLLDLKSVSHNRKKKAKKEEKEDEKEVIIYANEWNEHETEIEVDPMKYDRDEIKLCFPKYKSADLDRILKGNWDNDEREILNRFMKRNLFFQDVEFIPALGIRHWDGHIFIAGATGAGKSFMIKNMLLNDKKKRKIWLVTDLESMDPSLKELFEMGRMKKVKTTPKDAKYDVNIDYMVEHLENTIIVFDDISPSNKDVLSFRDNVLEKGRHKNIMAIVVNHQLRQWGVTKCCLNDSEFVICFPSANRAENLTFLNDKYHMTRAESKKIIDIAQRDGRYMIIHLWNPNFIATAKSLMMM